MIEFFGVLIAVIWWGWIVLSATSLAVIVGLLLAHFLFGGEYQLLAIGFGAMGFIFGIWWAESTRTKVGLDKHFGAANGAPTKNHNLKREDY